MCDYTTYNPIISQPLTRYAPNSMFAGCGSEELGGSAEIVRNMELLRGTWRNVPIL